MTVMTLQDLLGTELPIIQAPMAGVQGSDLALAVSNAGGLGSLPCAMLGPGALRSELEALRAGTDKPFNVNFFAHTSPVPSDAREQAWREALSPYYSAFGIDPQTIPAGGGRTPFSAEAAALVEEFRPAVVSFHFGLPDATLLQRVKAAGAKVLSTATTVEEALWLEQQGADAIIAQGLEAGGHRGIFLTRDMSTQMGTFALLPQVVGAVKVPVIAAGGIADAGGIRAAMDLGAVGVQLGTAFLLCPEATTRPIHREALKSPQVRHTAITNLFSGGPARGIMNRVMRELGPVAEVAPEFPLATSAIAPLRAAAEAKGSGDFTPLWSGQNASGCREIPAGQLIRQLAGEL
tara:strand:- start:624 stop:1670 length:1047 start_codon:yes stop_codon:yes gene_type:complete